MLNQPTIDKLCAMRMRGMAEALQQQMQEPDIHQLSFEERLGLLIDRQWDWRQNRALERRLRNARLQGPACVEDIDYRTPRGLDRAVVRSLTQQSAWVEAHQNLFLIGSNRNRQNLAGAGDCAEGLPRRLLGAVPESRRVVPRPGRVARRRQPLKAPLPTRPHRRTDRRRLGHGAADRSRAPRLPRDLRHALPGALGAAHQPASGRLLARADRRSDDRRFDPRPSGAQRSPHRTPGRIDASQETATKPERNTHEQAPPPRFLQC